MVQEEPIAGTVAIKRFFEQDGRKVTMEELKTLTREDKEELAPLCAKALGVELKPTTSK